MASSVRSTNSQGLKRCMVNRTHEDAIDETKSIQNKNLYKTRISERLKTAGTSRLTISFGSVEIREYPMILGFNPAVSQGPPLEIAWEHVEQEKHSLEAFEKSKPTPRSYVEMNIPMDIRVELLQTLGFNIKEINIRTREVKALRVRRLETQQQMYRTKSHERMEKFERGLKNIFTNKKKKELELMDSTRHYGKIPMIIDDHS